MTAPSQSPYQRVLREEFAGLHPRLRDYFGAIPAGSLGRGSGVFDVVGSPKRWLWPVLWMLGRQGMLFAAWEKQVPFTVTNRPIRDAAGGVAVAAVRTFHLRIGRASLPVPKAVSPTVRLLERFDTVTHRQHVSVTVDVPLLGRLYEYAGSFRYELRQHDGREP